MQWNVHIQCSQAFFYSYSSTSPQTVSFCLIILLSSLWSLGDYISVTMKSFFNGFVNSITTSVQCQSILGQHTEPRVASRASLSVNVRKHLAYLPFKHSVTIDHITENLK